MQAMQVPPMTPRRSLQRDAKPIRALLCAGLAALIALALTTDLRVAHAEVAPSKSPSGEPPRYTLPPILTSLDISSDGEWLAVSGHREVLLHAWPKVLAEAMKS